MGRILSPQHDLEQTDVPRLIEGSPVQHELYEFIPLAVITETFSEDDLLHIKTMQETTEDITELVRRPWGYDAELKHPDDVRRMLGSNVMRLPEGIRQTVQGDVFGVLEEAKPTREHPGDPMLHQIIRSIRRGTTEGTRFDGIKPNHLSGLLHTRTQVLGALAFLDK